MSDEIEIFEGMVEEVFAAEGEVVGSVYHRGARSSLGVPEEPDEYESTCRITRVEIFGVDITELFSSKNMEDEDLGYEVSDTGENLMLSLINLSRKGELSTEMKLAQAKKDIEKHKKRIEWLENAYKNRTDEMWNLRQELSKSDK